MHTSVSIRSLRRGGLLFLFLVFMLAGLAGAVFGGGRASAATPCTKHWTGAVSISWIVAGNWSPSGQPASSAYACIDNSVAVTNEPTIAGPTSQTLIGLEIMDGHTLTLNGTLTLTGTGTNASSLTSAVITGTGGLTVSGTLNWVSGDMTGAGSTTFANTATVSIAPTTTSGNATTDARTVTNNGTVNLTEVASGYTFSLGSACTTTTFVNNGTFTYSGPDTGDAGIGSCNGSFTNNGTFTKTVGADTTAFVPALNQGSAGTFGVNAGAVSLQTGSSTADAGTFTGTGSGQVQFTAGTFSLNNTTFSGGVNVIGGTLAVNAGNTLIVNGTNNIFTSGVIGGAGNATVNGTLTWAAGDMTGTGATTFSNTSTVNIAPTTTTSGNATTDARTVTNNGTVNLTEVASGYTFSLGSACTTTTFVNNGTFTYSGPATTDPGIGSCNGSFTNNGTFTKTVGADTTAFVPALNQGSAGTFGATAGSVSLQAGSSTADAGTFTGTGSGQVQFTAGTFSLNNTIFSGGVNVNGGNVAINPSDTLTMAGTDIFTSGVIGGAGNATVNGTLNWVAGDMTGTGATTFANTATVNIAPTTTSGNATTDTRAVTNNGTVNLTEVAAGYQFSLGSACNTTGFVNNGTLTYSGPDTADPGIGSCSGSFTNNGTFAKTAGADTTRFVPALDQGSAGTFGATAGVVSLQTGSTSTDAGSFTGTGSGQVQFTAGTFSLNNTSFAGGVTVNNAILNVNAGNTLTLGSGTNTFTGGTIGVDGNVIVNGTFNWVAGDMTGTGATTFSNTSTVNFAPTTSAGYIRTGSVTNNGTATLTEVAGGYPFVLGSYCATTTSFTNNATFTYTGPATNDPGIISCGNASFINNGTFTKTAGVATTAFNAPFSNSGVLNENAGTLQLTGGLGQFATSPGPLTGGTYSIQGNLQVPSLDVTSNSATIVLNGVNAKFNDMSSASGINGLRDLATNMASGSLTASNGKQLTVKNLTNAGTVMVGPGASSMLTTAGNYTQTAGTTTVSDATGKLFASGSTANIAINGGTLSGTGTVQTATATNTLTNAATTSGGSPATATGNLTVAAKYSQTAAGTLREDIAGTTAGSFDQLTVNQPVALAGTLAINTSNSYTPTIGDTLTIVSTSSGGVTGTFSSVTGTYFANSAYYYQVVYNASSVQVVVHQSPADLSLASSSPADVTADPTNAANNIAWTLRVGNAGPAPATNVIVTDTIPSVSQFVSAIPSQGSCGSPSGAGVVTCNLGSIAANPGTLPTVVVTVKPLDPAGSPSTAPALTNQATVAGDQPDTNPANNSASDAVNAKAQTGVTYVDDTDSGFGAATSKATLGNQLQYTFLGTLTHHLTDNSGLVNSMAAGAPRTFYRFKFQAAGGYVVGDSAVAGTSTVGVPPTAAAESSAGTLAITWSKYTAAPTGYGYDVTITGPLGTVKNLAPTRSEKSAIYTPTDGAGTYTLSARIFNTGTGKGTGFQTSTVVVKRAILLSSTSGSAGTTFTVSGKGFAANATVTIKFGTTTLTSATASASGSFSQSETVPAVATGQYTVTATAGALSSSATFTVT